MNLYLSFTILICLSAGFAYLNQHFLKLPFVIGIFILSTTLSLFILSSKLWLNISVEEIKTFIELTHIDKIILNVLLGFLLFAGALHTRWKNLKQHIRPIATFALGGVLLSTIIIASLFFGFTQLFAIEIDFIYCLLF